MKVVTAKKLAPMTKEEWERKEKEKNSRAIPDTEVNRQMYSENSKRVKEEFNYVLNGPTPTAYDKIRHKTFRAPQAF